MDIKGEKVVLKPLTRELCHEMYSQYVADPMMCDEPYNYTKEHVDHYFDNRIKDDSRRLFSIVAEGRTIGEIQIKYINFEVKKGNLAVHLTNDSVKGKGYGTEAERLILNYAFKDLGLETIYADAVLRNTRSQHIMEKLGFKYIYKDEDFKYYELMRYDYENRNREALQG